jgi:hypothetical protein
MSIDTAVVTSTAAAGRWEQTTYRWAGLSLLKLASSQGAFVVPGGDPRNIVDPHALAAMSGLHCFGASFPWGQTQTADTGCC